MIQRDLRVKRMSIEYSYICSEFVEHIFETPGSK